MKSHCLREITEQYRTHDIGNLTKTRPSPAQNFNNRPNRRKLWVKKNWSEKIFGLKKLVQRNFCSKDFLVTKQFGSKKCFRVKFFGGQIFFGTNCGSKKCLFHWIMGPKKYLIQKLRFRKMSC